MFKLYKLYKLSQEYLQFENYALAANTLQKMIRLKSELLGRNYMGCSFDLYNLGLINNSLKNYKCARRFLIRALQMQRSNKEMIKLINIAETLQILAEIRRANKTQLEIAEAA